MQVFGYVQGDESTETSSRLSEVSVVADSGTLRSLAAFLTKCADRMDESSAAGVKFGHEHFRDHASRRELETDVIVSGPPD